MTKPANSAVAAAALSWIGRAPHAPYFVDESGADWHPIGHNDAISWPELRGLLASGNEAAAAQHLTMLRENGVTCIRLMLEYAQSNTTMLERPAGRFNPRIVRFWDRLIPLCEQTGMRLLLTPFDTFFTWIRWQHHPYNAANGGPCADRRQLLTCKRTRDAMKHRLLFATERWGGSGAIFAWDLWNEMHPAHGDGDPQAFAPFIDDLSTALREAEQRLHGRVHLQTVSVFGPELPLNAALREAIYRHPTLDFATSHLYAEGTIDDPRDTVAPARVTAELVQEGLAEIGDGRPFLDSEHGPIHSFKDRHETLPEIFDDEYFRHMQWAHLASGGAGGGMRWPNRRPHILTKGMRQAQLALANFLPLLSWQVFDRKPGGTQLSLSDPDVLGWGCVDRHQAVVWLLRATPLTPDGRSDRKCCTSLLVSLRGLVAGNYEVFCWDTVAGCVTEKLALVIEAHGALLVDLPVFGNDLALAIRSHGT